VVYRASRNTTFGCLVLIFDWGAFRAAPFAGHGLSICLIAFSESPSEATWLENACFIAFSEPPSDVTWLENEMFVSSHFPSRQVKPLGLKMLSPAPPAPPKSPAPPQPG
jgi:hypothetical protein